MKVYDGDNKILGRLATQISQDLLAGEEVRVVNADKVMVTGRKKKILAKYRESRERGKIRKGPYYPRRPEQIFKRTVRGMLPYQQPRGRKALKRFRAYIGIPKEFEGEEFQGQDIKNAKGIKSITLGEVSEYLGAKF